ncbi:MAG TPA: sodium:proton antiporter, partial [Mycobacterium sp.]
GTQDGSDAKIAVLAGSVIAGLLAAIVLTSRNAAYRRIHEAETADDDHDGMPDVYRTQKD